MPMGTAIEMLPSQALANGLTSHLGHIVAGHGLQARVAETTVKDHIDLECRADVKPGHDRDLADLGASGPSHHGRHRRAGLGRHPFKDRLDREHVRVSHAQERVYRPTTH